MRFGCYVLIFFSFYVCSHEVLVYLKNNKIIERAKQQYGDDSEKLIKLWLKFINKASQENEWRQLHLVNNFFNQHIKYRTDLQLWKKTDYWATPIETLAVGMGDCEDYVIAKYLTLIALGVNEQKIRFMYVRQTTVNEPHMVLIYFNQPNETPFVLDNFNKQLLAATERKDLTPIYSFNGHGLWLAKSKGLGNKVKNSPGVSAWSLMLKRIEQGQLTPINNNFKGIANDVSRF
ncbi:transglutaminase-like cysteine peptidase [Pseudoalteromonas sp.]|uniref:transglutaminase-like cysteine peptidase n=1 Tax=Pseudoalteromonas sp. TaxID=53249 RepID=UPI00356B1B63